MKTHPSSYIVSEQEEKSLGGLWRICARMTTPEGLGKCYTTLKKDFPSAADARIVIRQIKKKPMTPK